jgi:hypothetical protein
VRLIGKLSRVHEATFEAEVPSYWQKTKKGGTHHDVSTHSVVEAKKLGCGEHSVIGLDGIQ